MTTPVEPSARSDTAAFFCTECQVWHYKVDGMCGAVVVLRLPGSFVRNSFICIAHEGHDEAHHTAKGPNNGVAGAYVEWETR